jgi:hypothetical protein
MSERKAKKRVGVRDILAVNIARFLRKSTGYDFQAICICFALLVAQFGCGPSAGEECQAKADIFKEHVNSVDFTVEEANRLVEVVAKCSPTVHLDIIEIAESEPNEETYNGRLAMLIVYRSARKAEQDPQLYVVTHPEESPEMEAIIRAECVGFIHPELNREEPEWCFRNRMVKRGALFHQLYYAKRDEVILHHTRTCLTQNGGIGTSDGLIEDSNVDWKEYYNCAVAMEKLRTPASSNSSENPEYDELIEGNSYQFSKETPLTPDYQLDCDGLSCIDRLTDAIEQMQTLPAGSVVRVKRKVNKEGDIWYKVVLVKDQEISGWVNSGALIGQDLERIL